MTTTEIASQKAKLLDDAPLCALVLDTNGHVSLVNKVFIELMGPQYKFAGYPFSQAPADDEGKALLAKTIEKVRSGKSQRERLRNLKMITLAGEAGLPVKVSPQGLEPRSFVSRLSKTSVRVPPETGAL